MYEHFLFLYSILSSIRNENILLFNISFFFSSFYFVESHIFTFYSIWEKINKIENIVSICVFFPFFFCLIVCCLVSFFLRFHAFRNRKSDRSGNQNLRKVITSFLERNNWKKKLNNFSFSTIYFMVGFYSFIQGKIDF